MNTESINIALLLDAKNEYNKHLIGVFTNYIMRLFRRLYTDAELLCSQENTPENILMVFQSNLSKIGKWSTTKITSEYENMKKVTGCDWFDDLIKVIFIIHTKIMVLGNNIKTDAKLTIKLPNIPEFTHLCI